MLNKNQSAFTLIELVMTIVILGILAAVAIPKYADLSDDANQSVLEAVRTNFKTAINIARSKSILNKTTAGYPDILLEGNCIQIDSISGFPLVDQTTAVCNAVASINPSENNYFLNSQRGQLLSSLNNLVVNVVDNLNFISSTAIAAPPPPPPPATLTGELPSIILGSEFIDWVWNKAATSATMSSPEGLSFTYNQNTGAVN